MNTPSINPRVLELLRFTEAHNRHTEALARATGEHFNVFDILGIGHYEVKTHSPMLGELLNPKGRHGQGAVFLRLFLDQFGITDFVAGSETAKLHLEYHVGPVTEKSGGRIDIVLKDGREATILIENKIYASDQENQMERYRDYEKKAHLFYLTLDRRNPSNYSQDDLNRIQCRCISYDRDILTWLAMCHKEAACLPHVRETISQYINLIKKLSNQSTTTHMNNDLIKEILKSKDSLSAFFALTAEQESVLSALIALLDTQLDEVAKATGLVRDGQIQNLREKHAGIRFKTKGLEARNLRIGCAFDRKDCQDLYFGFWQKELQPPCPFAPQLLAHCRDQFSSYQPATSDWWPAWAYYESPYRYWNAETFEMIRSGQFAENLKAKLEILAKIAKQVCPD